MWRLSRCLSWALSLLAAWSMSLAAAVSQPQLGPVLMPGMLKDRDPAPAALTMKTWASLKEAIDSIGTQVRQVLQVRGDLSMLQDDLRQQEATWQRAEEDLEREIVELEEHARQLQLETDQGASVEHEAELLENQMLEEQERMRTSAQLFAYEEERQKQEERRLEVRAGQLRSRLAQVQAQASAEVQKSRDLDNEAAQATAASEREAAKLVDAALDEASMLKLEERVAGDRSHDLRAQIVAVQTSIQHLNMRLIPPPQLKAQVNAMRAQVELETKAIADVQVDKLQAEAACEARMEKIRAVLSAEEEKRSKRHGEMTEVCDNAMQQKALLETVFKEACVGEALPASALAADGDDVGRSAAAAAPAPSAAEGVTAA